jgi:hypothetical protein
MKNNSVHHRCEPLRTGLSSATEHQSAPDDREPTGGQPVRTGSNVIAIASAAWHTPEEHAIAMLQWMQGPGGRTGEVAARELMNAYVDMCVELFWEPLSWIPVAKAFRRLIGDPHRRLASRNSRRIVVYRIPPSPCPSSIEFSPEC